jgi:hypothetical protein
MFRNRYGAIATCVTLYLVVAHGGTVFAQIPAWGGVDPPTAHFAPLTGVNGNSVAGTATAIMAGDGSKILLFIPPDLGVIPPDLGASAGNPDEVVLFDQIGTEIVAMSLVGVGLEPIQVAPPTSVTAVSLLGGQLGIRLRRNGTGLAQGTFAGEPSAETRGIGLIGVDENAPQAAQFHVLTFSDAPVPGGAAGNFYFPPIVMRTVTCFGTPELTGTCASQPQPPFTGTISERPAWAGGQTLIEFEVEASGTPHETTLLTGNPLTVTEAEVAIIAGGGFHVALWDPTGLVAWGDPDACGQGPYRSCWWSGEYGGHFTMTARRTPSGGDTPRPGWGYMLLTNFLPSGGNMGGFGWDDRMLYRTRFLGHTFRLRSLT